MSRPSRFGCFGCFWVVALIFGSALQIAALWWINPLWLQRLLPGIGPGEGPGEVVLIAGDPGVFAAAPSGPELPTLWPEYAVHGAYDPQVGLRLQGADGAGVEIPPGAIAERTPVSLTPLFYVPATMAQAGLVSVGPMHDLRVGQAEHWDFLRPIRLTLPFDRESLPAEHRNAEVKLATWEGSAWRLLNSTVDPAGKRITAETSRACIVTTIIVTTGVGIVVRFSEPGNALITWISKNTTHTYETTNFVLHYDKAGDRKVPPDSEYPLTGTRSGGSTPLYVQDMGRYLEEALSQIKNVGFQLARPKLMRWDVYLLELKVGVLGLSAMGGPLILDNDFRYGKSFAPHYEWLLRKTCAHELIHVAQNEFYSNAQALTYKWWVEATAEYLAVEIMERLGQTDPDPFYYIKDCPKLLRASFLHIPLKDTVSMYSYARYLTWLEAQGIDTIQLIRLVSRQLAPSPTTIDRVLRHLGSKKGLGEFTRDFALELHHQNLWSGILFPADALNRLVASRDELFAMLTYRQHRGKPVELFSYAEDNFLLPAVSARHYLIRAGQLPERRQAKLIVEMNAERLLAEQSAFFSPIAGAGRFPYGGSPTPMSILRELGRTSSWVSFEVMAAPPAKAGQFDQANLILVNQSLSEDGSSIQLRRWLLMAPEFVAWGRAYDGQYTVVWHEAELKQQALDKAFAGYNLYRRRWSDAAFPRTPINPQPLQRELFLDRPPADESWAYTVTVVDTLGNESAPAPLDVDGDPFVGAWKGSMRLIEGSIATTIMRVVRFELSKSPDAAADTTGLEPLLQALQGFLYGIDLVFRCGVPITYQVELVDGRYKVTPVEALGQPIVDGEPLMMSRVGLRSLAAVVEGKIMSRGVVTLDKDGHINQEFVGVEHDPDIGPIELGVKLSFKRQPPAN